MFSKIFSLALIGTVFLTSCGDKPGSTGAKTKISTSGSNTMQPIVNAWAEAYPKASVTVSGVGTGVGIEDMINGRCDICNASRAMKPEERAKVKEKTGKDVEEFIVGYDALAVYVHPSNPLNEISLPELTDIFKKGGALTKWDQIPGSVTGDIIPFGREKTSGTYEYFHEAIVGKKEEFVASLSPQSSSTAIITQIASIAGSIGYDGMAFKTDKVKWLKLAKAKGEPAVEPNANDARSKKYPLARPLYMYTIGKPEGAIKEFLDWAMSDEGQKILSGTGAVSLR